MTKELTVIHEQEVLGKRFKVYGDVENPLFMAKEVAEWIEHSKTSVMLNKVDEDEKGLNNVYTLGGIQNIWFITEDGLYELLMQSRKPIAKAFKKEVKAILKAIRRDGGYIATNEDDDDATILAKALVVAQKTIVEDRPKVC
ncbi:BRO-N domain-containing protein [Peribacillus simplex]|uniref:BRO-N domain-containing protein n=1 Tax=Peribacillus simplex TaxID=1478 RepID=UPI003D2C3DC8